jgi:hypothetical protein
MVGVAGAGAFYRQCVDGLDVWKGKTRVPVLGTLVGGISGTVGRRVPAVVDSQQSALLSSDDDTTIMDIIHQQLHVSTPPLTCHPLSGRRCNGKAAEETAVHNWSMADLVDTGGSTLR